MLLSKRLKKLRVDNNLTQKELGERVNVTKVSICCYENGTRTPTLDTLTKLAKIFDVELDYLMGYDIEVKAKGTRKKAINMAKEEIEFVKELRKVEEVHEAILNDPKRAIELITKKIK